MVDAEVQVEVEANSVLAGRDHGRLGLVAVVPRALVAAEIVAGQEVVVGGHEAVIMLSHIFVRAGPDAVEHQVREEEMGRSKLGSQSKRSSGNG